MWWWWSRGRTRILFQKSSSVAMLTGDHMTWLQCTIWFTTDHMLALPLVPDQPGSGSSPRRVTVMHTIQDCQAHMPFNTPPDWFTQIIRASDWLLARRPSCTDEPISPQILWLTKLYDMTVAGQAGWVGSSRHWPCYRYSPWYLGRHGSHSPPALGNLATSGIYHRLFTWPAGTTGCDIEAFRNVKKTRSFRSYDHDQ